MDRAKTRREKPLILIADDDITIRMLAVEYLQVSGFEVVEAENGAVALDEFMRLDPDAVVLDVQMPHLDGFEVCAAIKAMPTGANTPILMMTALEDVAAIHKSYQAGANEFTAKPVNWTVESHRLRNMIAAAESVKEIKFAKQEWEETFNAVDEIITIHSPDLRILAANDAAKKAAGNLEEGLVGRLCQDAFCASDETCATCLLKQVFLTGEKQAMEQIDGCMPGVFLVAAFPVFDEAGKVSRVVHTAKDITESHRMQTELRRSQKLDAIGLLAGGLSHDFNNLLQVIIAYASVISKEMRSESLAHEYLNELTEVALGGSDISRQLLTLARKDESKKRPLALNVVLEIVCSVLRRTIPQMIEIEYSLAPELGNINGDSSQIEQVMMNLAVNAQHAMPEGGRLFIETRNVALDEDFCRQHPEVGPGNYARLSVTDTGCGMDQKTLEHIFEPFFTTRELEKGTGLGLTMVVGIIQKHDGVILCESEPGQGTTFSIYLPVIDQEVEEEEILVNMKSIKGQGETILLVDDDLAIRNVGSIMLTQAGYKVLLAVDGGHALEVYKENRDQIDLVVLDLNMPRMGGAECLDHLLELNPQLSVLIASGFPVTQAQRDDLLSKAGYITKPYHETQLLGEIHRILSTADKQPIQM
jgi:two-component system cell cycle sensor histidine kinase/response regulator CckA